LDALEPQIGSDREVILVQSGIDGREPQLLQRGPWLRVLTTPDRLWPGQARNLGAAYARGELLAFLDADAVPSGDWLNRLEEALLVEVDAVAGAIMNGTPHSRIGTAEYLLTCSEVLQRRPRPLRHGPGSNLLIRRERFEAVGGFAGGFRAGEDTVLTFPLARSRTLRFCPRATVTHLNRTRLRSFLANQYVQGAAFRAVYQTVAHPHEWVSRGPALLIAGPLRLLALARCLLCNQAQLRAALRALPLLLLGTVAWSLGTLHQRPAGAKRSQVSGRGFWRPLARG
jgi:GT2 family glycosyltransferase